MKAEATLSKLQLEANAVLGPLDQGRDGAPSRYDCSDARTPPMSEDAVQGFVDGAGI
jgi:hypothetical protein